MLHTLIAPIATSGGAVPLGPALAVVVWATATWGLVARYGTRPRRRAARRTPSSGRASHEPA